MNNQEIQDKLTRLSRAICCNKPITVTELPEGAIGGGFVIFEDELYFWDGDSWEAVGGTLPTFKTINGETIDNGPGDIIIDTNFVGGNGSVNRIAFWEDSDTIGSDSNLSWDGDHLKIDGGSTGGNTGTEDNYKLQINMSDSIDYGLSVSNNFFNCDPWFHINSYGIGAVGNGTTIPFFSIESDPSLERELRSHVVPASNYSYIFAKGKTERNDLHLYANKTIVLQAGRANNESNIIGDVVLQGASVFYREFGRGDNRSALVIDQVGGNRLYQFDSSTTLVNLIKTGDGGFITGDFGIGAAASTSAKFQIDSTTKGFLLPRMTSAQAVAISSKAEGLLVYVTDTSNTFTFKGWWGWDGAKWDSLNGNTTYTAKSANYTITYADYTIDATVASTIYTLPTAVGYQGRLFNITNSTAGTITVDTTSSQTIFAPGGAVTSIVISAGSSITVQSTGTNWRSI